MGATISIVLGFKQSFSISACQQETNLEANLISYGKVISVHDIVRAGKKTDCDFQELPPLPCVGITVTYMLFFCSRVIYVHAE